MILSDKFQPSRKRQALKTKTIERYGGFEMGKNSRVSRSQRQKKGQPGWTAQKLCYRGYLIYAIAGTGIRKCGYSGNC